MVCDGLNVEAAIIRELLVNANKSGIDFKQVWMKYIPKHMKYIPKQVV